MCRVEGPCLKFFCSSPNLTMAINVGKWRDSIECRWCLKGTKIGEGGFGPVYRCAPAKDVCVHMCVWMHIYCCWSRVPLGICGCMPFKGYIVKYVPETESHILKVAGFGTSIFLTFSPLVQRFCQNFCLRWSLPFFAVYTP